MHPPSDLPRQDATLVGSPTTQPDIAKYTYSVADAVLAFHAASMSITERTVQRYCHKGKLQAVRVDPDTRQLTDKDNYLFLIDPASIPERVAQLREKQEFVSPTIVAARPVTSRLGANSHDVSQLVASEGEPESEQAQSDELKQLHKQVMSLEIDKRVRDGLLDQMKQDRKELLTQLQAHVETMTMLSREVGQLETRLELAAPQPPANDNEAPDVEFVDRHDETREEDNGPRQASHG